MFSQLTGNELAKGLLSRLIDRGRVPNALIFSGPEGVGKKQFAIELARSMICSSLANGEGCGKCSPCVRSSTFDIPAPTDKNRDDFKRVRFSEHADVGMVTAHRRSIFVDAIRDLEVEAHFRPYEADFRIFIVDNAEKMNDEASNALLKTLEEPPATSHIVLVTSNPDNLLQTIRSRSQMIRFVPVPVEVIETFLLSAGNLSPEDAALAARVSAGSIGKAAALDINAYRAARRMILDLLNASLLEKDLATVLQTSEMMVDSKKGYGFEAMMDILESLVRDLWGYTNGVPGEALVHSDIIHQLDGLARGADRQRLADWGDEIETLRQNLAVNINQRIAADSLFAAMVAG